MNKIVSFLLSVLTGFAVVLAVIAVFNWRVAMKKIVSLGVGLMNDWRYRVTMLLQGITCWFAFYVSPVFCTTASLAFSCVLLLGLKPRNQGEEDPAKEARMADILTRMEAGEDVRVSGKDAKELAREVTGRRKVARTNKGEGKPVSSTPGTIKATVTEA